MCQRQISILSTIFYIEVALRNKNLLISCLSVICNRTLTLLDDDQNWGLGIYLWTSISRNNNVTSEIQRKISLANWVDNWKMKSSYAKQKSNSISRSSFPVLLNSEQARALTTSDESTLGDFEIRVFHWQRRILQTLKQCTRLAIFVVLWIRRQRLPRLTLYPTQAQLFSMQITW